MILCQQFEQDRCARTRQTGDEHRAVDHFVVDLGMGLVGGLYLQARFQKQQDVVAGPDAAKHVEFGLGLDRMEQDLQRFLPIVRAKIVKPGVAARGFHQFIKLQRGHAARVP